MSLSRLWPIFVTGKSMERHVAPLTEQPPACSLQSSTLTASVTAVSRRYEMGCSRSRASAILYVVSYSWRLQGKMQLFYPALTSCILPGYVKAQERTGVTQVPKCS